MPNDCNGDPVKIGDRVMLHAVVRALPTGVDGCNCLVEIEAPQGEHTPKVTLNSRSLLIIPPMRQGD